MRSLCRESGTLESRSVRHVEWVLEPTIEGPCGCVGGFGASVTRLPAVGWPQVAHVVRYDLGGWCEHGWYRGIIVRPIIGIGRFLLFRDPLFFVVSRFVSEELNDS